MISYQQIAMLACPAVCGLAGGKRKAMAAPIACLTCQSDYALRCR